jgi:hypothetical protein
VHGEIASALTRGVAHRHVGVHGATEIEDAHEDEQENGSDEGELHR